MRHIDGVLAVGFGAGLAPKMPGTFGTLVAVPAGYLMLSLPVLWQVLIVVAVTLPGIWICDRSAKRLGVGDHPAIVWDEIAGFLLACCALPQHWLWVLAAFGLFRLLDIAKPFPISWVDRRVKGGFGVMADDVIAGAVTCLVLHTAARLL